MVRLPRVLLPRRRHPLPVELVHHRGGLLRTRAPGEARGQGVRSSVLPAEPALTHAGAEVRVPGTARREGTARVRPLPGVPAGPRVLQREPRRALRGHRAQRRGGRGGAGVSVRARGVHADDVHAGAHGRHVAVRSHRQHPPHPHQGVVPEHGERRGEERRRVLRRRRALGVSVRVRIRAVGEIRGVPVAQGRRAE